MVTLMPELITEILLWLPVKPLLRFRCVSRSFCNLIDSSYFIKEHLKRSMETRTHLKLIIPDYYVENPEWIAKSYYPTLALDMDFENGVKEVEKLNNPVRPDTYICGSCNGLLLLFVDDKKFVDDHRLALWNPYTRRCNVLPVCPIEIPQGLGFIQNSCCGLGYDSTTDDYKIMWILNISGPNNVNFPAQVWIFGLKSNSWRRLPDFPYNGYRFPWYRFPGYRYPPQGYFANGALHWLFKGDKSLTPQLPEIIVAFDMANETFYGIPQPVYSTEASHTGLEVLEGCLCMILFSYSKQEDALYIRKNHGDGFSWIELYTSTEGQFGRGYAQPLAYSKKGDKVLLINNEMQFIWYDLKEKTSENFQIFNYSPFGYHIVTSWESLVSLGDDSKFDRNVLWGEELAGDWDFQGPHSGYLLELLDYFEGDVATEVN